MMNYTIFIMMFLWLNACDSSCASKNKQSIVFRQVEQINRAKHQQALKNKRAAKKRAKKHSTPKKVAQKKTTTHGESALSEYEIAEQCSKLSERERPLIDQQVPLSPRSLAASKIVFKEHTPSDLLFLCE
jgi:lipopolysaccharide export system protein LptA